jgi:hypothetical protein
VNRETHCTVECEAMPMCPVCHRLKAPLGRSVPPESFGGYCTGSECAAYYDAPKPGHLWPGELRRQREEEVES